MSRRTSCALAAQFICLWITCVAAQADPLRTLVRFGAPPGSPATPSAVIGETRRSVLLEKRTQVAEVEALASAGVATRAAVRARLPKDIPNGVPVAVLPQLHIGGRTIELEPRGAKVQHDNRGPWTRAWLNHPMLGSPEAREPGAVSLRVQRPALGSFETRAVPVAPGTQISIAFGFLETTLEAATPTPPSRFVVRACQANDCRPVFDEVAEAQSERWLERRVPLPQDLVPNGELAVSFRFEIHLEEPLNHAEVPVWAVPELVGPAPSAEGEHDLLVISLDTLRADHLSTYGYHRETTPFLDGLASSGTVFEQVLSAATTTGPSHMSMFTGLPPVVHGVHTSFARALPKNVKILAEELRARGFATAAFTENGPMASFRGFDRGFESYFENRRRGAEKTKGHVEETLERGANWLRVNRDRRRFLFLHTFQVHTPYSPPSAHAEHFSEGKPDTTAQQALHQRWQPIEYDREIRYVDTELRRFFAQMEREGLLRDTIVAITSDHGDEFLEHGALVHGPSVHREVLQVPLLITGPGIARGRRVREAVSGIDLMPTLLDLAGAMHSKTAHSRSLAAWARSGAAPAPAEKALFSEGRSAIEIRPGPGGVERRPLPIPVFTVQRGDRKLIRSIKGAGARYEYFRLDEDPGATKNRWDPSDPEAAALRDLLEQHIRDAVPERALLLRPEEADLDRPEELDAERIEKLRALGYVE